MTAEEALRDAFIRAHLRDQHGITLTIPEFREAWPVLVLPDQRFAYGVLHVLLHKPPDDGVVMVVLL